MKKLKNNKGFTLVELLAVIVVLAIVIIIVTRSVFGTLNKSKAKAWETDKAKWKKLIQEHQQE